MILKGASKWKRFIAAFIDWLFITGLALLTHLGFILSILYVLFKDGLHIKGLHNRSIGKAIMGLKIINVESGLEAASVQDSVKRNFIWLVPLMGLVEAFFVLFDSMGRRIGDRIAATIVVSDPPSAT